MKSGKVIDNGNGISNENGEVTFWLPKTNGANSYRCVMNASHSNNYYQTISNQSILLGESNNFTVTENKDMEVTVNLTFQSDDTI